jgi:tungstate transport system ATP-binding protein
MSPAAIRIDSLEVRHGPKTILKIPHLSVEQGEILALIGPNGAGKSTLLQVLGLLEKPSHGRIFIDGQEVTRSSDLVSFRRRFAMVFQEPLLFRGTVSDNVKLGLRLRGVAESDAKQRAERWLAKLNISHLARRSVSELSVGEAQRVNLARSLVLDPHVFFLDEPFAALDPPTQASIVDEFQKILAATDLTAVFATHNRGEALMLGDRLAVMIDGQIAQLDTPENVFSRPASKEVAVFLGLEAIADGCVLSSVDGFSKVAMAQYEIVVAGTYSPDERLLLCVRPEDIILTLPHNHENLGLDANVIRGAIAKITPLETQFQVVVDCGFPVTVLVSKQTFIGLSLAKGTQVMLSFMPSAAHVISKNLPA